MILRLHHHRDIWQKLGAQGPGVGRPPGSLVRELAAVGGRVPGHFGLVFCIAVRCSI